MTPAPHAWPHPKPTDPAIYGAGKVKYRPMWKSYRDAGWNITSRWIDEPTELPTEAYTRLWLQIVEDLRNSDIMIVWCEEGDSLQDTLVEIGVAIALGVEVHIAGTCASVEPTAQSNASFHGHPLVSRAMTVEDAIAVWKYKKGERV